MLPKQHLLSDLNRVSMQQSPFTLVFYSYLHTLVLFSSDLPNDPTQTLKYVSAFLPHRTNSLSRRLKKNNKQNKTHPTWTQRLHKTTHNRRWRVFPPIWCDNSAKMKKVSKTFITLSKKKTQLDQCVPSILWEISLPGNTKRVNNSFCCWKNT